MSIPDTPEGIRAAHLAHEASVKSIGSLYYVYAIVGFGSIGFLFGRSTPAFASWVIAALWILMSAVYFQVGRWFRTLNPKARTPGMVLAVVGLLGFPIGTLINAYVIYLIQSKKSGMVFSDQYKDVIAATPSMKYKASIVAWVVIISVLLVLFILVLAFAAFSGHQSY